MFIQRVDEIVRQHGDVAEYQVELSVDRAMRKSVCKLKRVRDVAM